MAVHLQYRFGLKSNQAYAPEKPLKTEIGAVSVENRIGRLSIPIQTA